MKVGAQRRRARLKAGSFVRFAEPLELRFEQLERSADRHIKIAGGFEELLAIAEGMAAIAFVRQRRKKEPRPLAQLLREQVNLRRAFLAAQQHIGIARKILEAHI